MFDKTILKRKIIMVFNLIFTKIKAVTSGGLIGNLLAVIISVTPPSVGFTYYVDCENQPNYCLERFTASLKY